MFKKEIKPNENYLVLGCYDKYTYQNYIILYESHKTIKISCKQFFGTMKILLLTTVKIL